MLFMGLFWAHFCSIMFTLALLLRLDLIVFCEVFDFFFNCKIKSDKTSKLHRKPYDSKHLFQAFEYNKSCQMLPKIVLNFEKKNLSHSIHKTKMRFCTNIKRRVLVTLIDKKIVVWRFMNLSNLLCFLAHWK